jgi:hypothetical protein
MERERGCECAAWRSIVVRNLSFDDHKNDSNSYTDWQPSETLIAFTYHRTI